MIQSNRPSLEQTQALENLTLKKEHRILAAAFVILAVGFAVAAWVFGHHFLYLLSGLAIFLLIALRRNSVYIEQAGRALKAHQKLPGRVWITTSSWSDVDHFYAEILEFPGGRWKFEFIPLDWKPVAGDFQAELYRLPDIEWPALVALPEGFLFPRYRPKRIPEGESNSSQRL